MKYTVTTRLCHFRIYILMTLAIIQLVEFSYCQTTEPRYILCGEDLHRSTASVCRERGYMLDYDPTQAYNCCSQGCSYLALSVFCNPKQTPISNRPRYILCGNDFNTALDSLCVNFYDISRASYVAPQCCSPGCTLSTLLPLCNRQTIGQI
ncbi:uncharacterized protein LOC117179534 [Belonocnema kinseyi]|uniref:uncharacterized protein LOC117179534 n=1 Tax=Belonocnema kinseyi TaxID=2817044 RepID=UPI00143D8A17|nr:uncharacterized protein LOC117179534 [Belonocnema kinseyi]